MTADERKDARLHIRLTPSQDRALSERARAAGVTKTDYVTAALEGTVLLPAADRDLLRALQVVLCEDIAHRWRIPRILDVLDWLCQESWQMVSPRRKYGRYRGSWTCHVPRLLPH